MQAMVVDEEEERRKKRGAVLLRKAACTWLRATKVRDLMGGKRRLVEVPYTATLSHTVNVLLANDVVAVPVAAPPGRWIGAGGSMILESDPVTGAVRKHYIGMVTMLDILVHIAEETGDEAPTSPRRRAAAAVAAGAGEHQASDLDRRMEVPVSSVIGHSLEGLSLWTLNPNTSLLDCMEAFSKGVHRALVPVESRSDNVVAVELTEASPGYRMLTQMDLLRFLRAHQNELKDIVSRSVGELGAVNENVFSVTKLTKVIDAIKAMRNASLSAVPIVEAHEGSGDDMTPLDRKGRKLLLGTFSATDLRACPIDELQRWLSMSAVEFKAKASRRPSFNRSDAAGSGRGRLVTCYHETTLAKVMEDAVDAHVHRVWVVDGGGYLTGIVSLTDVLGAIRESLLAADREP